MQQLETSHMDTFPISYHFDFGDDHDVCFDVELDKQTLELVSPVPDGGEEWTALEYKKCPNCPLDPEVYRNCPVALNLVPLIRVCGELSSYERVCVEVETPERRVTAETTIQRALSSLLGLIMATSNCPHTRYFRPMARFHLLLASDEETVCRAVSMYLLAQYFLSRDGLQSDMELKGLSDIYHQMHEINRAMSGRLRAASLHDAAVNAVVLLDLFAKGIPYSIEDALQDIRYLFGSYLDSGLKPLHDRV